MKPSLPDVSRGPVPAGSLVYEPVSYVDPLPLETLFPEKKPLDIDLGAGDGSFLVHYAMARPERNFLGVERLMGRFHKIDRKGRRAGLKNLLVMRIEGDYFTRYLLPPGKVSTFHLYFPDPWPKKRHEKKRLVQPGFAQALFAALEPTGKLYLRTDNEPYYRQMCEVIGAVPGFEAAETPEELKGFQTDFEREWLAVGRSIHYGAFCKCERE